MKRFSTLLVTPSPTARDDSGRASERACLSDGWMGGKDAPTALGWSESTAKNEPQLNRVPQLYVVLVHLTLQVRLSDNVADAR